MTFEKSPRGVPRAAVGHMPFPGHRTCKTIRLQEEAHKHSKRAQEYGYDPDCLKAQTG